MPETIIVECPKCDARLRVPHAGPGRTSVKCPKCGAPVPLKAKPAPKAQAVTDDLEVVDEDDDRRPSRKASRRDDDEDDRPRSRSRRDDDDEDDRPARKSRREDDDDEDDRPRSRSRRDDDDDDEDDRPRRKKKRRKEPEAEGPWLLAVGAAVLTFLLLFGGCFAVLGTSGVKEGEDGPGGKLVGLGVCFLVSLVIVPLGIVGVKNRESYGRWGFKVTGTMGVILGMIQTITGSGLAGFSLYGLIFTLVNGR